MRDLLAQREQAERNVIFFYNPRDYIKKNKIVTYHESMLFSEIS